MMKSADEIIIEKEWQELSPAEKSVVAELAASEKEYNLLKKMLQVTAAEVYEVPQLDAEVLERIKTSGRLNKNTSQHWKKWIAAAAVVTLIFTLLVIKKPAKEDSYVKEKPVLKTTVLHKDSIVSATPETLLVKQPATKNNYPVKPAHSPIPVSPHTDPADNIVAFAAVTVADGAGLLDLIAEAE